MTTTVAFSSLRRFMFGVFAALTLFMAVGPATTVHAAAGDNVTSLDSMENAINAKAESARKVIAAICGGIAAVIITIMVLKEISRSDGKVDWGALGQKFVLVLILAAVGYFVGVIFAGGRAMAG